jgi:hypothetical protein
MARKPLNARQFEVLTWISDGCPDGVMGDSTFKLSAIALKSRQLVTVSKRGGWHAAMTDDGTYYLANGRYPEAESARPAPEKRVAPSKSAKPASGRQRVQRASPSLSPSVEDTTRTDSEVAPIAAPKQQLAEIPVPEHLRNPHPIVVSLRENKGSFDIVGMVRHRALRIAQGLIRAAEQRGWTVQSVATSRTSWGREWDSNDHFVIDTGEYKAGVRFEQEDDRTPHEPTAHELRGQSRYSWTRIPKYDYAPSDRLRIELGSLGWRCERRQHSWGDGKRGALIKKLPSVMEEIAVRHEEALKERIESERKAAEEQRLWQMAVEEAKVLLRESHRAEVLAHQAASWRKANDLREYVRAMEEVAGCAKDAVQAHGALDWIQWARDYANRLDPLEKPISLPEDPEPTDEALEPFLPRRNHHGYRW